MKFPPTTSPAAPTVEVAVIKSFAVAVPYEHATLLKETN